jgi:adenosylcobyric acid synthase
MSQAFHGGRLREARERFGRDDFLDFSVNTNAFWTAPTTLPEQASREAWTRYPEADAAGIRLQLASIFKTSPEHLQPTAGAIEALYLAARLFPKKNALILHPSFADYTRACRAAGLKPASLNVPLEVRSLLPYVSEFAKADVVFLGTPANPTGTLFRDRDEVIDHPALKHVCWILDEAFVDFTPGGANANSLLNKLEAFPQVILLGALTKSWGLAGLRIGFAATAKTDWMRQLRTLQPPWSVNGFAEHWAQVHLNEDNLLAMRQSLAPLAATRATLQAGICAIPGLRALDSDANYFLVESYAGCAAELADALGRAGILVRICDGFEGLDPKQFLRVAVRCPAENQRLVDGLSEGMDALSTAQRRHPHRVQSGANAAPASARLPGARFRKRASGLRAISVLGTSSNSGKSWMATALCALMRRRGLRVAPFKAQNMSNNSAVAWDGGEIGRAQAAQAEACRLPPSVRMNPILLKPSGASGSQLVVLGKARGHVLAGDYYKHIESLWPVVTESLAYWETRADLLVLEGAGSPVELNLIERDLVNFRPVRHLDGRWLLVADIERGGVFAQAAGTWSLAPEEDRKRCIGLVVNKFRGDLSLFSDAALHFAPHFGAPHLGTLPFRAALQPEGEDSLCVDAEPSLPTSEHDPCLYWIRLPHVSNAQDADPWREDTGIHLRWITDPHALAQARVVIIPGSKNTLADLRWLHENGMSEAIRAAHARGAHVVGICGGFQMLGRTVSDPAGIAGDRGTVAGLGLLPVETVFSSEKRVCTVTAEWNDERWNAYEIHMGQTRELAATAPLIRITDSPFCSANTDNPWRMEGVAAERVWGTYLHGLFESTNIRRMLASVAGADHYQTPPMPWRQRREAVYESMADLLEEHLQLEPLWRYVAD